MSFLRPGHGNGAGRPHIEVPPFDELPVGMPADASAPGPAMPDAPRASTGQLLPGAGASERARRAAEARWAKERARSPKVLEALGLRNVPPEAMLSYLDDADDFAKHEVARLAREIGGGICGPAAASIVQTAALQTAASRFLFASGDPEQFALAARLGDSSRQNLLAAHTLCALEAKARAAAQPQGTALAARLAQITAGGQR